MNIDEYLNNLQNDLDDQLSRFGVSDQPAANMFSVHETEEKKFCPECGNKVAADAKFCPECGFRFQNEDADNELDESSDTADAVATDYDPEELSQLLSNIDDARRSFIEKAQERLKTLSQIAAEQHEQDFGWTSDEVPDSDEDEDAYEEFLESQFHVIRYDDFAYQTSEIIGIRFRLEGSGIVITAYYDDDSGEIVEDCDLYFSYDFADNYRAVAFCIDVAERELGLEE
jgi:hypothetical protein